MDHCKSNPDFILLFIGSDFLHSTSSLQQQLQPFLFTVDDSTFDLTKITEFSDHRPLVRFQSAYWTSDSGDPIIFDSGASISVSPHKSDFIHFDSH